MYIVSNVLPRKQAQRFANKFGLRARSNQKPGQHLPYDSPLLEEVRTYVRNLCASKSVHPRLVCNFDQVWSLRFRPKKDCYQKESSITTLTSDTLKRSMYLRKVRHQLEVTLGLPVTEKDPTIARRIDEPRKPLVTGGKAASATVNDWRVPRTVTTCSWIDGFVSRSFVTLKEGSLPREAYDRLQKELGKWLVLDTPQTKSHMWNESTFLRYLDYLSEDSLGRRVF